MIGSRTSVATRNLDAQLYVRRTGDARNIDPDASHTIANSSRPGVEALRDHCARQLAAVETARIAMIVHVDHLVTRLE